jgi:RNA polymerase sigma factor (sigma-70 family)
MVTVPLPLEYEQALITKAKAGDMDAYMKLRTQFDQLVDSFSSSSSIPKYDREDIRQELELAFHEAVSTYSFDKGARFITHLHNMLRYRISGLLKELKRDKRRIVFEDVASLDNLDNEYDLLEDPFASRDFDDVTLKESLSEFNETEKEILDRMIQGYKNQEIGTLLEMKAWRVGEIRQAIIKKLGKRGEQLKSILEGADE